MKSRQMFNAQFKPFLQELSQYKSKTWLIEMRDNLYSKHIALLDMEKSKIYKKLKKALFKD